MVASSSSSPSSPEQSAARSREYVDLDIDSISVRTVSPNHKVNDDMPSPDTVGRKHSGGTTTDAGRYADGGGGSSGGGRGSSPPLPLPLAKPLSGAAPCLGADAGEEDSAQEEARRVNLARQISLTSLGASLVVALLGLSLGVSEAALSLIGFGGEALLDAISSSLVLWRFKRPKRRSYKDSDHALSAKDARDARRERNSSIGIGWTFVFYGVGLFISAVWKVTTWDPETSEHKAEERSAAMYGALLAWPSAAVFGVLAATKWRLAGQLGSQVLAKDALCSALGTVLALICGIAALIEQAAEDNPVGAMAVDASAGLMIAVILFVEGARTLWHNLVSNGNGSAEAAHRPFS